MKITKTVGRTARDSNVRWLVMGMVLVVTLLTYLDRLNLSIAGKSIEGEWHLSTEMMGWVFSAFLLGYALLQIPGGILGDRLGPRKVMAGAITLWSVFTILTAYAPDSPFARWIGPIWILIIVRFLVGVGEAASSPNGNKVVGAWMGSGHRGIGSSFSILGIGIGGAATPPLIAAIMLRWGWRFSFLLAGLAGLLIAGVWFWLVRDTPEQHPSVSATELQRIHEQRGKTTAPSFPTPWKRILSSRSTWGLILGYMCQGYPIYFYHTWFFLYLVDQRGLSIRKGSFWGSLPYVSIALLAPIGGWASDFFSRKSGKRAGRRLAVWTGMFLSALLLWAGSHISAVAPSIIMLSLGAGFNMFAATTFWATCIDLSPSHTASISGLMNTFGNLGGWLSPIVTAYVATKFGWNHALYVAAAVTLCSGIFFSLVTADRSLDQERANEAPDSREASLSSERSKEDS